MTCTVCRHPRLDEIDEALLSGASKRSIADHFKLAATSIQRHKKHIAETIRKAHEAKEVVRADSLIGQLKELQQAARRIQEKAEKSHDYRGALAGVRELSRLLALATKISESAVHGDGFNASEWTELKQQLYRHTAHVMCAVFKADDRVVLVITEEQASELARELRQIFGLNATPEQAVEYANKGLALTDPGEQFLLRPGAPDPPVGRRF